jgi:hypothetical protein
MEPFDEGGVEHPAARDRMAERLDGLGAPLQPTALDSVEATVDLAFDDLHDVQPGPLNEGGPSWLAGRARFAKNSFDYRDVSG